MPKISVIIPVYNVKKYLNRCVDSILNQTLMDFELILVDDGSTDGSGLICDNYEKRDRRIKVIHKSNSGQGEARNRGIDIALGEYLHFVDSDDWIHPQMLEVLYNGAISNNVKLSACTYKEVSKQIDFEDVKDYKFEIIDGVKWFINDNISAIVPVAKLYHKDLFDDVRYPKDKKREDEFTTYKLLYKAREIAFCNKELYMYFINTNGSTKQEYTLREEGRADILKSKSDIFLKYRMDYLEALRETMDFFKDKDQEAFIFSRMRYKQHIMSYFKEIYSRKWEYLNDNGLLIKIIREDYEEIKPICHKYEKLYFFMIKHNILKKWIAVNDFEPIQNIIRQIMRK